jgi:hypothetical protein
VLLKISNKPLTKILSALCHDSPSQQSSAIRPLLTLPLDV